MGLIARTIGGLLFGMALLLPCGNLAQSNVDSGNSGPVIPNFKNCPENLELIDVSSRFSANLKLDSLSYSYTYTIIASRQDSLEREKIRLKNGRIAKMVVQNTFPDAEILNDSILRASSYNHILTNTAGIFTNLPDRIFIKPSFNKSEQQVGYDLKTWKKVERLRAGIHALKLESNNRYQLFIKLVSIIKDNGFKNLVNLYIFDNWFIDSQ